MNPIASPSASPVNMALQGLQGQRQTQDPGIIGALNQKLQQGAQTLNAENAAKQTEDQQAAQQLEQQRQQRASISRALGVITPKNTPNVTAQVGKSIATPAYAGFCQGFVDDTIGAKQRYPTAAATWQAKVQNGEGQTDVSKAAPGDVIEFQPDSSNQNMGHAALVTKDGLLMATDNGVKTFSLKDWTAYTGQVPSGFYKP